MIENPIPQISLNDSIDMGEMFEGAKKLMQREGMISKQPKKSNQLRLRFFSLVSLLAPADQPKSIEAPRPDPDTSK